MEPFPDLLYDFAYAKLAVDLTEDANEILVDDVTHLPANSDFVLGEPNSKPRMFWMTIESQLTNPNTFEIVQVVGVDAEGRRLLVQRGQQGTDRCAHSAGTYIKGAITAAMLRKLALGIGGAGLPVPDGGPGAWFDDGQQFYNTTEHAWYYLNGGTGAWAPLAAPSGGDIVPLPYTIGDTPTWALEDATETVGLAQPLFHARWFTFTPDHDTVLHLAAANDSGIAVGMALYDTQPGVGVDPHYHDADGSAAVSRDVLDIYAGQQYWVAVGATDVDAATTTGTQMSFSATVIGQMAQLYGSEVLRDGTALYPTLTAPMADGTALIFIGYSTTDPSSDAPTLTVDGSDVPPDYAADAHLGGDAYGLAVYRLDSPTEGEHTLSCDLLGDTLTGALAVYMVGHRVGGVAFPPVEAGGMRIDGGGWANDVMVTAVNVDASDVSATPGVGELVNQDGTLIVSWDQHHDEAGSATSFTWTGDANGTIANMVIRGG